jgi:DUF1707 SHOCT-like domain
MSEPPALRASDADREGAADRLRHAAAEGRLTVDELEARLHDVYAARTQAELQPLVADLPVPADPPAGRMPVRRGEPGTSRLISILGGHERKGRWRIAPQCRVVNILGGSELDITDAELAGGVKVRRGRKLSRAERRALKRSGDAP